jgi:Zn-dependent protease/CBS domain-containing protein
MFGKPIDLFRLFGIMIRLDVSWFVVAALISWSLASGFFPVAVPGLSASTYWAMGIIGALGLFLSVLIHEFAHALVAQRKGIAMRGITLFLFGGVAEMDSEPPSAKAEFLVAIAGPIATLLIAGFFFATAAAGATTWPRSVAAVLGYLTTINVLLAIFNMVPAFPLDGGRVLRAVLWHWKRDLRNATRITSGIGSAFGMILIGLGIFALITGSFLAGMWWALIGLFLRAAAAASYQQVLLRDALGGEPVRRFMRRELVSVSPSLSLESFVEDYIYRHHHKLYPVTDEGRLVGCITTREVKAIPRTEWATRTVGSVAVACTPATTVTPDTDAIDALARMRRSGASRLLVIDGEQVVGILTLKDLLALLALKLDLER